jgi:hypothetical protein
MIELNRILILKPWLSGLSCSLVNLFFPVIMFFQSFIRIECHICVPRYVGYTFNDINKYHYVKIKNLIISDEVLCPRLDSNQHTLSGATTSK